ncbi:MAG: GPW/gp25 family protein [Crocinitomicaceae bacterium]|nr:GPW/gp25 family protein [Crocinitomicaceae bacterium]
MSDQDELLGTGWKFPPTFHKHSDAVEMVSGELDVDESIYLILHTKLSERIMRPDFGSNIHELIFEPLNANLETYMISSLKAALAEGEPRIVLQSLTLEQPQAGIGRVDISIEYSIIETHTTRNLVIPFYTPENTNLS